MKAGDKVRFKRTNRTRRHKVAGLEGTIESRGELQPFDRDWLVVPFGTTYVVAVYEKEIELITN